MFFKLFYDVQVHNYLFIVGIISYNLVISLDSGKNSSFNSVSILCPNFYIFDCSLIVIVLGLIAFCMFRDLYYKLLQEY
jgi:hypothetical protein